MKGYLEVSRTSKSDIEPGSNVTFNVASPFSDEIVYDSSAGEFILTEIGQYSVKWWVATETALTGCIQFAITSTQGDTLKGCSTTKIGQVTGFGHIDALSKNVRLSLVNTGDYHVVLSKNSPVTSALVVEKIPAEGVIPTFNVDEVQTLEPGLEATVDLKENTLTPDDWLFSFGIPKGDTGAQGVTPHIDTDSGNWFIGSTDTNVHAQGPTGPAGPMGPVAAVIPFALGKYGLSLTARAGGEPSRIAFSGFGSSYYDPGIQLKEGEWATGTITIDEYMDFGTTFIMPNTSILKKIYVMYSNEDAFEELQYTIRPFICIAVSNDDTPVYTILQDTIIFVPPYESGTDYIKRSFHKGSLTNLNIEIVEGTTVAIVAGIMSEQNEYEFERRFAIWGGLYLE